MSAVIVKDGYKLDIVSFLESVQPKEVAVATNGSNFYYLSRPTDTELTNLIIDRVTAPLAFINRGCLIMQKNNGLPNFDRISNDATQAIDAAGFGKPIFDAATYRWYWSNGATLSIGCIVDDNAPVRNSFENPSFSHSKYAWCICGLKYQSHAEYVCPKGATIALL